MATELTGQLAMFGNGLLCSIVRIKPPAIDLDGQTYQELLIVPGERMKYFEGITGEELSERTPATGTPCLWKRYPKKYILRINHDNHEDVVQYLVLCTFRGEEGTEIIMSYHGLQEQVDSMLKTIENLKIALMRLGEEHTIFASGATEIFRARRQIEDTIAVPDEVTKQESPEDVTRGG